MGLDTERFVEPVDPELRCKLCGQVLDEPLSAPCGHVFCASCLLPWAVRQRRCPLRCQPICVQELHRVLPLRNLVQRLPVKCDYSARGCRRHVLLRQLAAHVEHCAFSPARCRPRQEEDCAEGLDVQLHRRGSGIREGCGLAAVRRKQQQWPGCGEASDEEDAARSCCPRALGTRRSQSASCQQELKRQAVCWRQDEKALLGQLAALQSEVQLTALKYQHKLSQYVSHLGTIPRDRGSGPRSKTEQPKIFTIMLHRENDTLGFNITGGKHSQNDPLESAEGIYVSRILVNGPADKTDGLQINDKIIQIFIV
ncbi:PREDICTED: PDZ domain-containing RING finger protein 4-like [Gekko japonicus]|uniref:PDZ domain-containing RING finger protein 4-like n=1 Tax=Gekko japonicus TaxID=146911 RepID=A0ABM1JN02_GEKJA|nr:PREDICTED: PDZ domain-containing RING finger protein 4-like [Gekko japonicus]